MEEAVSVQFLFTSARMLGYWDGRQQHQIMPGNFYGLTWSQSQAWVSWQRDHVPGSLIMAWDGEILDLPEMRNVHDMLYEGQALWITDTGHDRLIHAYWLDSETRHWRFPLRPEPKDSIHANSLWGNPRLLVLESGLGGANAGFPARICDIYGSAVLDIGALFCHNLYVEDGVLYGCYKKGDTSGVYRMPIAGEPELFPFPGNWFLRGLARGDGFFLFGRSVSVERKKRKAGHSAVLVMDDDLQVMNEIELRNTGQLCSVRLLEGDRAHNGLGFPFMEELDGLY